MTNHIRNSSYGLSSSGNFNNIQNVNPYYYARYGSNIKAQPKKAPRILNPGPVKSRLQNWKNIRIKNNIKDSLKYYTSTGAKKIGKVGLVGAGIAAAGLAVASGISSYAQSLRRPPVVHTGRLRSTGQTNQYYNLGADPFAGVRFAGRKRNFMM
ncbi:MAG: hypothetical protein E6R13_10310 [Spirochaetes bacterium]|nr:MAG: hypothetical protein E6R13_10310 [Spirochaetota bacterium]